MQSATSPRLQPADGLILNHMPFFISSLIAKLKLLRKFSSGGYWNNRYQLGGNSGPGSYGHLAEFKATVLNQFVRDHAVSSVVEFGCGDGNQLALARYPTYVGYDVSPVAVKLCRERFVGDRSKQFFLLEEYGGEHADLALSLDVIFHLTEDTIFYQYVRRLFGAAHRFVIIYSSNQNEPIEPTSIHVRHRRFSDWVERELSAQWKLLATIPNIYPYDGNSERTSFSNFFVYEKR
jgi:SAM-dependent methyltransferase